MSLAHLRKDYTLGSLRRADLDADPLAQFHQWFADAHQAQTAGGWLRRVGVGFYKWLQTAFGVRAIDPNAMTLATVDAQGRPSARTVLLKGADERGFIFFTNHESRKGRELAGNPHAALAFYWKDLERQICVSGMVERIPGDEAERYFHSRPRGSQIGAWASKQSVPIPDREFLEARWRETEARFPDQVPLPPFWGGYVLHPERIEFWQGGASRLHDRFQYTRQADGTWKIERLSP
jgi:pyridoxamine 5'-phosphate oxidase